jgi:4-hydroxy-tetrahydrodipicolinate synthase
MRCEASLRFDVSPRLLPDRCERDILRGAPKSCGAGAGTRTGSGHSGDSRHTPETRRGTAHSAVGLSPWRGLTLLSMATSFRPERLFVPVITPFDYDGHVDEVALERHADEILAGGAAGIVAVATTGEATALDDDERAAVISVCARVCSARDAILIVGAGTYNTRETIARHEALADVPGARASLAVVPYYVRPSEAAIVAHFQVVAERSPVPLIVYNIPYRTARGLGSAALLELAATENVVGVKQAVGGIDADTLQVLAGAPGTFSVLGGDDAFLLPLILMGGAGAIAASANIATNQYAAMIDAGLAGDVARGRRLAEELLSLTLALFAEPSPAVIKAVLHARGRIPTPHVRMPLTDASATAREQALAALGALTTARQRRASAAATPA